VASVAVTVSRYGTALYFNDPLVRVLDLHLTRKRIKERSSHWSNGPEQVPNRLMGNSIEESLVAMETGDLGPLAIQSEECRDRCLPAPKSSGQISDSQGDVKTWLGESAKRNSIKVGRSSTKAGGRHAKILVETASCLLSYQRDRRILVLPEPVAEFVVGTYVIGAIVSN
jgi:hypothetical protein